MVYLKEEYGGADASTQSKMYFHLLRGDEPVFIAVNSYKNEIEGMNKAKDQEELQILQESAVNDAKQMNDEIARYFGMLKESYSETITNFKNVQ